MNKNYLLIAVLMSVGMMTSCSSSDTEETPTVGNPAVVNLQLNGKAITRSTPSDKEATISSGQAAAFDASGAIVGTVQNFSTSTPTINTTTQATQVSVVANPGTTATTASFGSILNKGGLEAVTTDLASTATSVTTKNSQDPTKLPKYGNTPVNFSTNANITQSVDMYNLVGKIKLSSIKTDFLGTGYAGATFVPKEVFLYNANTTCTFGGTGSAPQTGENTSKDGIYSISPNDFCYLSSGVIASYNEDSPTAYTFYTFPNTDTTKPTKIVIKGEFKPSGGSPVVVYYPIVVNRYQGGTTITKDGKPIDKADVNDSKIVQSTSYDVSIIIKGKGMDSPDSNITPATATITMNVKNWTDYTQEVTVE